jgi:hypothetical protein
MVTKFYALFVAEIGLIGFMSIARCYVVIADPRYLDGFLQQIVCSNCHKQDKREAAEDEGEVYISSSEDEEVEAVDEGEADEVDEVEAVDDVPDITAMLRSLGRSYRSH